MSHYHAVVWLDHSEAHVIHFTPEEAENAVVKAGGGHPHLHHKSGSIGAGHSGASHDYMEHVIAALQGAQEILVTGPANAKQEFVKYLEQRHKDTHARVVGVETMDHPSDGQLLAFARKYVKAKDRLLT
ncbi:MAG: translational machinery protein [Gammaproteobacteria bacterium]|nr:translational machinery protein [Gammaproteobacteria bacterium]